MAMAMTQVCVILGKISSHAFATKAEMIQTCWIQMQQKDTVQAFCIYKLWYKATHYARLGFLPNQHHELQYYYKVKAALSTLNGDNMETLHTAFGACYDALQTLTGTMLSHCDCLSPCLQQQQQPVARYLTHLFLLWVMTGKKEGKSRVKSQGPFSAVASASPSSLACWAASSKAD